MKERSGKKFLCLVALLLLVTGCGKTEASSNNTVVPESETVMVTEEETEIVTEIMTETESETENEAETVDETETEEMTETEVEIEYTVTPMEEVSMYAVSAVNVRKGPSTDFDRVGGLRYGKEVKVTGQASTGWYEIVYGEEKVFVSDKYLQNEPMPEQPVSAPVSTPTTNIILIGDSRTAEMRSCVGENPCIWIAEHSKGIKWFVSDAVPAADPHITQGTKVIINLGANDPEKIDTYIYTINEVAANWTSRGATVYYATVGPCYQNPYHTNDEAVNFNAAMVNNLSGVRIIDLYTHLVNSGFATRENDGFHYDPPTYASMYSYYMNCIR